MSALDGYRSSTYDEAVAPDGSIRPEARAVMDAVLSHDLATLAAGVRDEIDARGITFESVDGDDRWHVDPVPRVIDGAAWERVAAGLAQRVRALNAFVADVYGERLIVAEGVLPGRVLDSADHLEPGMAGVRPRDGVWIGIAGLDLVRDAAGDWLVLEDNLRTPSGIGYWATAREAILSRLDGSARPVPLDDIPGALRRVFGDGRVVVLTDGPDNSAHWEHDWIARRLGVPLVVPHELEARGDRLLHDGAPVDAIYRRTNDDEVDSGVGALLAPAVRAGRVKMVNCFGTGIGDDKLAHAYVQEMVQFYLGEEPLLGQVETFDLGDARTLERALDVFDELVIKDRGSYGGLGVVVCPHAERADVKKLRARVRAAPADYVAQRLVGLSTHPTVIGGRLAPRHVDLRPFVLMSAPDAVEVLPGGVTRVALDEGALVVNSSQNGGAKDTWVLP
ncbi:MAG TPA: circularly permuted type 2 ATP-grasp protein [Solirubrobacteraceae bacterium]|nr:circularly permuted type 2 ATP-grasp protein [Solirubrobacteraceae bacterium]